MAMRNTPRPQHERPRRLFGDEPPVSPAVVIVALTGLISTAMLLASTLGAAGERGERLRFWLFAVDHTAIYRPMIDAWNDEAAADPARPAVEMRQLSTEALVQRLLGLFYADIPGPDLIEVERAMTGQLFKGPVGTVGLLDLTDRLRADGLLDDPVTGRAGRIPANAFSPWTKQGRVFGIPHDVHPVLLGYRADIVEAAGIDVGEIETWEDFARVLSPIMRDEDGDGVPEHRLLGYWSTHIDKLECMLLQAGGGYFDTDGGLIMDSEVNARTMTAMAAWLHGPNPHSPFPIAADVPDFSPIGNAQKVEGRAIAFLMPDWMTAVWKRQIPELHGRVKVMPLPAWERGGRRASVWGGTMLGIGRHTPDPEVAWRLAERLYLSEEAAIALYRRGDIITPMSAYWDHPAFAEPDPYYAGQAKGLLYIAHAAEVPPRPGSPFYRLAFERTNIAMQALARWVAANPEAPHDRRLDEARRLLRTEAEVVRRSMRRSAFAPDALAEARP